MKTAYSPSLARPARPMQPAASSQDGRGGLSVQNVVASPTLLRMVMLAMLCLAAFSVIVSLAGRVYGGQIRLGGNSVDTTRQEIVIANAVLNVPSNHIRLREQRVSGVSARLDLYALWPAMTGYALADRAMFEQKGDEVPRLLFISIEPQQMSRDMTGRLEPIYRQLVEPVGVPSTVPGLDAYAFRADRAVFNNETLFVASGVTDRPFVARCMSGAEAEEAIAPCERDVFLPGGLSAKYRFPAHLLADFAALDAAVIGLMDSFLAD
ncbi:MAG: hypothetical protein HC779_07785 [Phyllobacteriaceae bacterium]|nr:hypothetical protein [Phyllobacteriaceae bacterium]